MNGNASIKKLERNLITATLNSNNNALNRIAKTIQQQLNARKNTTRQRIIRNIIGPRYIHGNLNALARNLANSRNLKVLNSNSIRKHLISKYVLTNNGGKTRVQTPAQAVANAATKVVVTEARRVTSVKAAKARRMVQAGRAARAREKLQTLIINARDLLNTLHERQKLLNKKHPHYNKLQTAIEEIGIFLVTAGSYNNKKQNYNKLVTRYRENLKQYLGAVQAPAQASRRAALVTFNKNIKLIQNVRNYHDIIHSLYGAEQNNNKKSKIKQIVNAYNKSSESWLNTKLNFRNRQTAFTNAKTQFQRQLNNISRGVSTVEEPINNPQQSLQRTHSV